MCQRNGSQLRPPTSAGQGARPPDARNNGRAGASRLLFSIRLSLAPPPRWPALSLRFGPPPFGQLQQALAHRASPRTQRDDRSLAAAAAQVPATGRARHAPSLPDLADAAARKGLVAGRGALSKLEPLESWRGQYVPGMAVITERWRPLTRRHEEPDKRPRSWFAANQARTQQPRRRRQQQQQQRQPATTGCRQLA